MKRHLLLGILVISLVFNIAFATAYLFTHQLVQRLQSPEGRVALVADHLGVSEEIKQRAQAIERERVRERKALFAEHQAGLDAFYDEAVREHPDHEKLEAMIDEGMTLHRQMLQIDLEHFLEIAALLEPDERRHLAEIIRQQDLFPTQ